MKKLVLSQQPQWGRRGATRLAATGGAFLKKLPQITERYNFEWEDRFSLHIPPLLSIFVVSVMWTPAQWEGTSVREPKSCRCVFPAGADTQRHASMACLLIALTLHNLLLPELHFLTAFWVFLLQAITMAMISSARAFPFTDLEFHIP